MKLTIRKGFTLVELVIATLIFGFMVMSLATLHSTASKHMLQSYRQNTVKSNASVAMKTITARLAEANRIDAPTPGNSGNTLRFAVNVDQTSGCYPINTSLPASWHEFCHVPGVTTRCPLGNCLYYHTGPIAGGGNCPNGPFWNPVYPPSVPCCGCSPGYGTVVQLASYVQPLAGGALFYRTPQLGNTLIKIRLRILWDPAAIAAVPGGRNFTKTAKIIDKTLNTTVRINRTGQ
ncbi:MAG: hypothetical protein A2218_12260 [Elusimicrobia bacterium RIFOXYA2_FULL_53_38]|nr:MAG: hypothetical protein A2218_12260 [Elusimicrobia bacterium RIFOXYA2_FULL_53_38]